MSPLSVCFTFSLIILSEFATVKCYSYQTEPLFLSIADLAALGANSHLLDPVGIIPAAEDDKVKTFVVKCHEDTIEVVMQAHLFDPDLPVEPTQLTLGQDSASHDHCSAKASGNGEYIIRAPLTECGNKVTFTESAVLYSNLLQYSPPPPSPGDTLRLEQVAIPVECEYRRRYTVSSRPLKPTWSPFISVQSAHLSLDFHLRLMGDDWSSERKSPVYFLGETVNIEASFDHPPPPPLRLYVGSCVATLTSDVNSFPRYPFIDHQGCFTDSQLSGSSSHFLPRVQDNLLQIQLEPFLFYQDHRHTIYITCYLEAVPITKEPAKKACSFIRGRWRSVDGDDDVCESCDGVSNHRRVQRSHTQQNDLHGETTVGPLIFLPGKAAGSGSLTYLY